jgi:hypothetical protein
MRSVSRVPATIVLVSVAGPVAIKPLPKEEKMLLEELALTVQLVIVSAPPSASRPPATL